jgi:hypothetical protein
MGCSAQIECERKHIICERRKSVGYDLRMGNPVYAIDEFPDDHLLALETIKHRGRLKGFLLGLKVAKLEISAKLRKRETPPVQGVGADAYQG